MSEIRERFIDRIRTERGRHFQLPGSEWDEANQPNDWIAIAGTYLFRESERKGAANDREAYVDSLVKAAAVILAALEHSEQKTKGGSA